MSPAAKLAWRLAAAVLVAGGALAVLYHFVRAEEVAQAAAARALAAQQRAEAEPGPIERLGFPVHASDAPIHVAIGLAALAPDVAPVLAVLADGSLALRRPPRPFDGPLAGAVSTGILVPAAPLAQWSPAARAAFAAAVGALAAARPVPAGQVRVADAPLAPADLRALLSWVP
ncbi:MAG: hypothetical protein FJ301_03850 [Planctomycetes bacterium]|nr:hypothetical protein [Planctomycetota bacterium]